MSTVKAGDTVNVHYHGKLTDGTTFDSSEGRAPLQFTVGEGQVIKGFDDALIDMKVGDKKTVNIPVEEAYGPAAPENFIEFPKTDFPPEMEPVVGAQLHLSDNQGNQFPVVISEVKEETVVLDANHPLAGKDLIFDIELVSIG
ncbi:FKBP-type peptidyl-prolyl cis-trans isomerase [Taibaiella chishuiensis]|uniref:Peptidyl-prolyl cis-trans isomerase n=1 Tax=Taibaiella chishuiensis TaxID=1434707 RepID=A0A2P8DB31_9BACT|nr:peptidylprolyl isomerase [Taibaiella chishuiensis]PSK94432.1 peptidylprolyl isomerase [Taibaiella chishuiensis]